jgi:hypothetical protein
MGPAVERGGGGEYACRVNNCTRRTQHVMKANIAAIILLLALLLPGFLLGLYLAPWFFLLMLVAAVVPLYMVTRPREKK